MKKVSFKNLSLLGLVLMGASVVTAAFTSKKDAKVFANGNLFQISDNNLVLTCKAAVGMPDCDFTATDGDLSFTSNVAATSSDGFTTSEANTGHNDDDGIAVTHTVS